MAGNEPYMLWFGKYAGASLEEIALGKKSKGRVEGYSYFDMLATGDRKYFAPFQDRPNGMARWKEIRKKLNNFVPVYNCWNCKTNPATFVSIAGSFSPGYSMGRTYICCDDAECRRGIVAYSNTAQLYRLGFDTILQFDDLKANSRDVTELMLELAGWTKGKRLTSRSATDFIDNLVQRSKV